MRRAFIRAALLLGACLALAGDVRAQAPVIGQGGAAPSFPAYSQGNHNYTSGPTPVVTGCGSTPTFGTDTQGIATLGANGTCLITFTAQWPVAPMCIVNALTYTVSVSAITVPGATAGSQVTWSCVGRTG
jgi:hypothetical protein